MNRLSSGGDGGARWGAGGASPGAPPRAPPPFTHSAAAATAAWTSAGGSVDCSKGGPAAAAGFYVGGVAGGAAWTSGLSPLLPPASAGDGVKAEMGRWRRADECRRGRLACRLRRHRPSSSLPPLPPPRPAAPETRAGGGRAGGVAVILTNPAAPAVAAADAATVKAASSAVLAIPVAPTLTTSPLPAREAVGLAIARTAANVCGLGGAAARSGCCLSDRVALSLADSCEAEPCLLESAQDCVKRK